MPDAADSSLLAIDDLAVHYPVRGGLSQRTRVLRAVDGVSLALRPGECLGLVGESGCGKSTLALSIMGLVAPTRGTIRLAGKAIDGKVSPEQRRALGINGGLIVEEVRNAGVRTELRPGDLIRAVVVKGVQTELVSVEQFNSLLGKFERSETITLWVRRGENQLFITIRGVNSKQAEGAEAG